MAVESAADLAAFFDPGEFGQAASYRAPGGGAAVPCTVLLSVPEQAPVPAEGLGVGQWKRAAVRSAELALLQKGGTFTLAGTDYDIALTPALDGSGAVWLADVEERVPEAEQTLVRLERRGGGVDGYGTRSGAWAFVANLRAWVTFDAGAERRAGDQLSAGAKAIFRLPASVDVRVSDRFRFEPDATGVPAGNAPIWNILSVTPEGADLVAVEAASAA